MSRVMFNASLTAVPCWPLCTVSPTVPALLTWALPGSSWVSDPLFVLVPLMSMVSTFARASAGSPGSATSCCGGPPCRYVESIT